MSERCCEDCWLIKEKVVVYTAMSFQQMERVISNIYIELEVFNA